MCERPEQRHIHISVPLALTVFILPVSCPRSPISSSITHSSASVPPRWMQENPASPSPFASASQFEERPHWESLAFTWKCLKTWSMYFPSRAKARIAWINWETCQLFPSCSVKVLPRCRRCLSWRNWQSPWYTLWGPPIRHLPPPVEPASQSFRQRDQVFLFHH